MPRRIDPHRTEAPLPQLPQQRVDSGFSSSSSKTEAPGGLLRNDLPTSNTPASSLPRQPMAALTTKFPFLASLAGTAHQWKPEQRFVLAIGNDNPTIMNGAQVKAFERRVPEGNRFRGEAHGEFGRAMDGDSLKRLDLSGRLDISAHGNDEEVGPKRENPEQLAQRLYESGLREVGVLKIEACKVGESEYLHKLKAELDKLGVKVGYLSAPKDFTANLKTYGRDKNGKERVFKEIPILPGKTIGGPFSPETFGLAVVKGNVDIAFPGTRYNLASSEPTRPAHGDVNKPLPPLPGADKPRLGSAKLGKLFGKAHQKLQAAGQDLAGLAKRTRSEMAGVKHSASEFKQGVKEFAKYIREGDDKSNAELAKIRDELKKDFGDFKARLKAHVVGAPPDHAIDLAQTLPPEVVREYDRVKLKITSDTVPAYTDEDRKRLPIMLGKGGFNTVYSVTLENPDNTRFDGVFKPLGTEEKAWFAKSSGIPLDNPQTAMRNIATVAYAKALGFGVVPDTRVALLKVPAAHGSTSTGRSEPVLGLVMQKATGTDARHTPSQVLAHPEVAREVTKLQLLDHLTGQGDRHSSNYFVHVDPGGVKVSGIDNDLSFGEKMLDPEGIRTRGGWGGFNGTLLPPVIDKDMAKAIEQLTPEHLESMLGNKLTDPEVKAAKERLKGVKQHIERLRGDGLVVEPAQWNQSLMAAHMNSENSYAARDFFAAKYHEDKAALEAQQQAAQRAQMLQAQPGGLQQQRQQAHPAQQVPW